MAIDTRGDRISHSAETDDDLKAHPRSRMANAVWCRLKSCQIVVSVRELT